MKFNESFSHRTFQVFATWKVFLFTKIHPQYNFGWMTLEWVYRYTVGKS